MVIIYQKTFLITAYAVFHWQVKHQVERQAEDQAKHHEKRVIILSVIMISGFKIVAKEHLLSPKKKTPAIDIGVKPAKTICL